MSALAAGNLTKQIVVALLLGVLLGGTSHYLLAADASGFGAFWQHYVTGGLLAVIAGLFIALLKMLVVPLVFISLVAGISGSNTELSRLGRLGALTFALYLCTTAVAVLIALCVGSWLQPGAGIALGDATFTAPAPPSVLDVITGLVPANPVAAFAQGNLLQVIVFALFVGVALVKTGENARTVRQFFAEADNVMLSLVAMVMRLAPVGVFALVTRLFAEKGFDLFAGLAWYAAALLLALLLQVALVYAPLIVFAARVSVRDFFRRFREPMLLAFSTASSAATLPVTLRTVEQRFGVPRDIASFTLPFGATVNMDGTAIMQGVATCFIAQAYGVDLSAGAWLAIIATATLASIGTAAVPSAGLVTLTLVLTQVGLPFDAIGLILGIDRFLDMARTTVNVTGDAVVTAVIARREGRLEWPAEPRD
jgi:Na+/H+-dicarboxylate symporter